MRERTKDRRKQKGEGFEKHVHPVKFDIINILHIDYDYIHGYNILYARKYEVQVNLFYFL